MEGLFFAAALPRDRRADRLAQRPRLVAGAHPAPDEVRDLVRLAPVERSHIGRARVGRQKQAQPQSEEVGIQVRRVLGLPGVELVAGLWKIAH